MSVNRAETNRLAKTERESRGRRPHSKVNSKASDRKTIKTSEKKGDLVKMAGMQSFHNSNNMRASDHCLSDIECRSETKQIPNSLGECDKKTEQNKGSSRGRIIE